ncbi:PadR family transcriptional regulator [Magnetococcales bacterium HHB-1]
MEERRKLVMREILLGFWKIHILHHAAQGAVVGHWMLQELRRHGYNVSPGTLYPLLNRMEKNGWLRSEQDKSKGPKSRKSYFLTEEGQEVLDLVSQQVKELCHEVSDAH